MSDLNNLQEFFRCNFFILIEIQTFCEMQVHYRTYTFPPHAFTLATIGEVYPPSTQIKYYSVSKPKLKALFAMKHFGPPHPKHHLSSVSPPPSVLASLSFYLASTDSNCRHAWVFHWTRKLLESSGKLWFSLLSLGWSTLSYALITIYWVKEISRYILGNRKIP